MQTADAVIIGAGAAGLMCAIEAGKRGRRVVVLEHNRADRTQDSDLRRRALQFHQPAHHGGELSVGKPAFRQVGAGAIHAARFYRAGGAARHSVSREDARAVVLRPRRPAEIVHMLEAECAAAGVRIETACAVARIGRTPGGGFEVETSRGTFRCAALVIATGGLSIPKMGATPFGYQVARQFGLRDRGVPRRRWCR